MTGEKPVALQLHPSDDVAIAVRDIQVGESVSIHGAKGGHLATVLQDVPKAHKVAVHDIAKGADVRKYGYPIGRATQDIQAGEWIHSHNLETNLRGLLNYQYVPQQNVPASAPSGAPRTFDGFVRPDGGVGVRNEIWILNTVGCINKVCEVLARESQALFAGRVDGVYHFPHPFGCSQLGDDLAYTQQLLASLAAHPNAGGVLIAGLGCESNQIALFRQFLPPESLPKIRFLRMQDVEDELEAGLGLIRELVENAEKSQRERIPLSKLKIGLKCGGSDGFSGITANPLVGALSDVIVAAGGTTILTEVPEMFGAEEILMNRAVDEQVFGDIVHLINDFKQYFIRHGQEIYENPSPGNKAGGITTLEEKSLGCTQKGGSATVTDVLAYGHRTRQPGLNLLQAPGNDLVSVTALAAAGAHIVLFTTGRGTPFGGPVPTVKIATHSALAQHKKNWIDFDAGPIVEGRAIDALRDELMEYVLGVASGTQRTANEVGGYREIAIFKDGVTM